MMDRDVLGAFVTKQLGVKLQPWQVSVLLDWINVPASQEHKGRRSIEEIESSPPDD